MLLTRFLAATPLPTLAAKLPNRYGFAMAMLASTEFPLERGSYTPEPTDNLGTATLLRGCVMDGLFNDTNQATIRVLRHNGYTMIHTPHQYCCGALHAHTGDLDTTRDLARRNIEAFEQTDATYIVTNSAGCGAMLKDYAHLLRDDDAWRDRAQRFSDRVRDVSELLDAAGPQIGGLLPFRATYDAPCHLYHGQRITSAPLVVLAAIPGLDLIPLRDAEQCCGSAGVYNLVEPETSTDVLNLKLSHIHETRAALVVTGNPGCLMHIGAGLLRAGMQAHVVHPVDLLDASYASDSG
jgi:glycolate oxidase iron-sulfur subunit